MELSKSLLEILVCPLSKQKLRLVGGDELDEINGKIVEGHLVNSGGDVISDKLDGALARLDGTLYYPIRNGIPIMLAEEGFCLDPQK